MVGSTSRNMAGKQCFLVCLSSVNMARKQCFLVCPPLENMARKQCVLVCPPSGNMARNNVSWLVHLQEAWLENNVSCFSRLVCPLISWRSLFGKARTKMIHYHLKLTSMCNIKNKRSDCKVKYQIHTRIY